MNNIQINQDKYIERVSLLFDELEALLLKNSKNVNKIINVKQYEEALGILTIEKSELEQKILKLQEKCNSWHIICTEVITKLSLSINNMLSLLEKENNGVSNE